MDKNSSPHNGLLFSHEKEQNLAFVTMWVDLEGIILSEISQTEKDKCHGISLKCEILKKKQKQKQAHVYGEPVGGCQRR